MTLAIVLPTRHRPAFAISAIESLLAEPSGDLSVFVSDDSSSEADLEQLAEFCRGVGDDRLTYLRPPEVLPMPTHWNWALEQTLARTDATHIGVTYDRKVWRPGSLRLLADVCRDRPEQIVTYICDFTYPSGDGAGAWQMPATGKLYELRSATVLEMTAEGLLDEMGQAFPLLSNCVVPRRILERVRERFGDICDSSTPDTAFAYRFCALEDRYLHLDRPLGVLYGRAYSTYAALNRGETAGSWGDFTQLWGDRPWTEASPLGELRFASNVGFHEYNLVRAAVGGNSFPPIQREGYLRALARGLPLLEDSDRKAEMRALLEQQGWREEPAPEPGHSPQPWRPFRRIAAPLRRVRQLFGEPPPEPVEPNGLTFGTDEQAIEHLLTHVRRFESHSAYLDRMQAIEQGTRA
jgi:hypothetical protein